MRKWFLILSAFLVLTTMSIVVGIWQWHSILNKLELEDIHFQLQKMSREDIQFANIDFIYNAEKIKTKIELNNVHINLKWNSWYSPQITLIQIEAAKINELNKNNSNQNQNKPQTPFSIPSIGKIPAAFPEQIRVKNFSIDVVCPTGSCSIAGEFDFRLLTKGPDATAIHLDLKVAPNKTVHSFAQFSGQTKMDLEIVAGKINHYLFTGDIHAEHLKISENWKAMGINADALHLKVHSKSDTPLSLNALPLAISGEIQGTLKSHFSGDISIDLTAKKLTFDNFNLSASIPELKHPQLKSHSWTWQGKIQGDFNKLDAHGVLTVGKSITIDHHIQCKPAEIFIEWKITDIFLLAANPFASILNTWPPLASLTRGKIQAKGNLLYNIEKSTVVKTKTDIQLQDVSGIYDTVTFQGINTVLNLSTSEKSFQLATQELKVDQIDKGFIIGPMQMSGKYQAALNNPAQGKLMLERFQSTAMGGNIATGTQEFDFSRDKQSVMLELKNIDLATLLKQHSSSELTGNGLLSGTVPLEITGTNIRILEGLVSAEEPGGQLKYSSERARAMAKAQPSMKLVTEALSDFHYSVLANKISYDEMGKLRLGVRLEGSSPAVENGRPIHFNVNIEEDVPAMLASIQLSGKVTDIIRKRLHERTQKKTSTKTAP